MSSNDQEPTPHEMVFARAVDAAWAVLPSTVPPAKGDVAEALRVASDVFAEDDQVHADKLVAETRIAGFNLDGKGRLDLVLAHELAAKMTLAFKAILDAQPGAENYVEQEVVERNGGARYVFIVCKPGGKTPHALRREADAERDVLRALPTLTEALDTLPASKHEYEAWMREHGFGHGAGIGAVIGAVRADLRKLAGGEGRG